MFALTLSRQQGHHVCTGPSDLSRHLPPHRFFQVAMTNFPIAHAFGLAAPSHARDLVEKMKIIRAKLVMPEELAREMAAKITAELS